MTSEPLSEEDRSEIAELVTAYALAMDANDLDVFPRLFIPDGCLVVMSPDRERPLGTFTGPGPDGIGIIAQLMKKLYRATMHHITSHESHVDGDAVRGTTYCLAYHMVAGDDGGALETLGVQYIETFVRTDEGWRFSRREATRLWSQSTPTPTNPLLIDHAAAAARGQSGPS
jgi:SnoaL-like domain